MKIILITDSLGKGGKERRLLELLKYFDKQENINVLLVLLKDLIDYPLVHKLKNTKITILKRKIKKDPLVFFYFWKVAKNFKPHLIHSWGSMPSVYAFPACYILKIPFLNAMISNAQFNFPSKTWLRAKVTFPFSDCILSNSYSGLIAYKVPVSKGNVIYNGVFLDRFIINSNLEIIRKKIGISTKYIIGMVAAFHLRKDYNTFIKAAIEIISENDDVTFITVGDGPLLYEMKSLVPQNCKEKILFLGKQDNVEDLISIFDIGVLTTNYNLHKEGISNAIIEYMALGKPVIATYGGGTPEIIDSNINGFIIPPFNVQDLIRSIKILLSDKEKRRQFGLNGKLKIEKGFNIKNMGMNYLELYNHLLKKLRP